MRFIKIIVMFMCFGEVLHSSYGSDLGTSSVIEGINPLDYQSQDYELNLMSNSYDADKEATQRELKSKQVPSVPTTTHPLSQDRVLSYSDGLSLKEFTANNEFTHNWMEQEDITALRTGPDEPVATKTAETSVQVDVSKPVELPPANSSRPLSKSQKAALYIEHLVQEAFADADSWMQKGAFGVNETGENKKSIILKKINTALDSLGKSTKTSASMQKMGLLAASALDALDNPVVVGRGKNSIENKVIAGVVNSLKSVVHAALIATVEISSASVAAGLGSAAGAGIGLGAGVNRLVQGKVQSDFVQNKFLFHDVDAWTLRNAPKIFVNAVVTGLHNIVQVPVLVAYGAAEGIAVGGILGFDAPVQAVNKIKALDRSGKSAATKDAAREQLNLQEASWLGSAGDSDLRLTEQQARQAEAARVQNRSKVGDVALVDHVGSFMNLADLPESSQGRWFSESVAKQDFSEQDFSDFESVYEEESRDPLKDSSKTSIVPRTNQNQDAQSIKAVEQQARQAEAAKKQHAKVMKELKTRSLKSTVKK